MKFELHIHGVEQGKASFNRDENKLTEFPPKKVDFDITGEFEFTPDEIAMAVAQSPSNLGCEGARHALATKLMELWAKVATKV